jgi:hypothetical protein
MGARVEQITEIKHTRVIEHEPSQLPICFPRTLSPEKCSEQRRQSAILDGGYPLIAFSGERE